jgi:sodium-coupled monocarboxylate transporter 8/12
MNFLDWSVIFFYIAVVLFMAFLIRRSQYDIDDYYLAGKRMRWWQSGLSTMATQLSAISFVSAPAFVAMG